MSDALPEARSNLPAQPSVGVVLVNWNNWRDCIECLDTLLRSHYAAFHVYLVDNASEDGSVEHIAAWCAAPRAGAGWLRADGLEHLTDGSTAPVACRIVDWRGEAVPPAPPGCAVTLVRSGGNLGFAGGNNVGMQVAGLACCDYFWLLNTDTVVDVRAMAELVERAMRDPAIGMVGSTLRYYDRPDTLQTLGGARLDRSTTAMSLIGEGRPFSDVAALAAGAEAQMAYVMGASMLVSSRFVREVGLMQEDYFLYFEEIDWAFRGQPRYSLAYAPRSLVYHKAGGSSAKVASWFSLTHLYRNRIRFVGRFMPDRLAATKRQFVIEFVKLVLKGRWRQASLVAGLIRDAEQLARDARAGVAA